MLDSIRFTVDHAPDGRVSRIRVEAGELSVEVEASRITVAPLTVRGSPDGLPLNLQAGRGYVMVVPGWRKYDDGSISTVDPRPVDPRP